MIELNKEEFESLRTQFATSKKGGIRYAAMAFTEQGVCRYDSNHLNQEIQIFIFTIIYIAICKSQ